MKNIIKLIGCLLLAFAFSIVNEQREIKKRKETEKQNIWVKAGVQDHQNFKNNGVMMVENGTK